MTGGTEIRTRNDQQVIFLCAFTEGAVVRLERLREQIKRAVRLDTAIPHRGQTVKEQVAVGLVDRNIAGLVGTACRHALEHTRRTNITECAACTADSGIQFSAVGGCRRHEHIADTLTRQRQRLGVRVADNGIVIKMRHKRHLHAIIYDLAVRLIRNEVNRVTVFLLLIAQYVGKALDGLLGVHCTGRVVRRVDNDRLGVLIQALFESTEVNLKIRDRRRHNDALGTGTAFDEHFIFRKIRCKHNNLVTLADNRLERTRERGCRACSQVQAVAGVVRAETLVEAVRQCASHVCGTLCRGIAVQCNRITCRFGVNRLTNGLRGGYVRVADREIEYVLAANDRCTAVPVLEQLADCRTAAA